MPLVDVQVIKGVFNAEQKAEMIQRVTDAMVSVEGEAMRNVTWVRVQEINEGEWAIGGQALTADAVHAMQKAGGKSGARPATAGVNDAGHDQSGHERKNRPPLLRLAYLRDSRTRHTSSNNCFDPAQRFLSIADSGGSRC